MRYAVISDIHGNIQALKAVLTDALSVGVDEIISLGDLVGYGPNPAEVLELAYARVAHFVLGNHDAVIAGILDPYTFNDHARAMIDWTADRLDRKAGLFLRQLPYVLTDPLFRCAHGNPACPGAFAYVLEEANALEAWSSCPEQLLFVGHSHVPGLYVVGHSGTPHWLNPTDFACEPHKRYIVNVGSVGQPRNGDIRASYCVLDTERREVHFRQVPFDLDHYRRAVLDAGLAPGASRLLRLADSAQPPPLRDMLDFHPLDRAKASESAAPTAQLHRATKAARCWRLGALTMLAALLLCLGAAWRLSSRSTAPYSEFSPSTVTVLPTPEVGTSSLPPPACRGRIDAKNLPRHWLVRVDDPNTQHVNVVSLNDGSSPVFHLNSACRKPMSLRSTPVRCEKGMRFKLVVRCRVGETFRGHATMVLALQAEDGTERRLLHYPLDNLRADRWKYAHKSSDPAGLPSSGTLTWILEGAFEGTLEAKTCELERIR